MKNMYQYSYRKFDEDNLHDCLILGRLKADLTQRQLAQKLKENGVILGQRSISRIERGEMWNHGLKRKQKLDLFIICKILNLDYQAMLLKDSGRQIELIPLPHEKKEALNIVEKVIAKVKYFINYLKHFTL